MPVVNDLVHISATDAARFWSGVDRRGPDECWPWTRGQFGRQYGGFRIGHRPQLAHRVAYCAARGPIPSGMLVLHACDNGRCCNPAHLRTGTHAENMDDKAQRHPTSTLRRTHCANGHEYTPENTYLPASHPRSRVCKTCRRISRKARNACAREERRNLPWVWRPPETAAA